MTEILNLIDKNSTYIIILLCLLLGLLFLTNIISLVFTRKINKKLKTLMRGEKNMSLEEIINSNLDKIDVAISNSELAIDEFNKLYKVQKNCINKVSVLRFKAFEDVGSDLSYSVAILDSYDNGVILTGIYSRHDSTSYAKPIKNGHSSYELSMEEKQVLQNAINSN